MSKRKPPAFKAALEEKLRQLAAKSGQLFERLQSIFVMDRFAARMLERYPDEVLVKGGYAMEVRLHGSQLRARTTKDLDISFRVPADSALEILQEICQTDLGDFLSYEVRLSEELTMEGNEYGGTRYTVGCFWLGKLYRNFGLDIAFGEPQMKPELVPSPLLAEWLNSEGVKRPSYRLISREQHLAEKLHAYTIPRSYPNSRVRDFPDMGLLVQEEILADEVLRVVQKVFEHRNTHKLPQQLPVAADEWSASFVKLTKTDPSLPWKTLDQLQQLLNVFWNPLLAGQCRQKRWSPLMLSWFEPADSTNSSTNDLAGAT